MQVGLLWKLATLPCMIVWGKCRQGCAGGGQYQAFLGTRSEEEFILKREEDINLYECSLRSRHTSGKYWSDVFTPKELRSFVDDYVSQFQTPVLLWPPANLNCGIPNTCLLLAFSHAKVR